MKTKDRLFTSAIVLNAILAYCLAFTPATLAQDRPSPAVATSTPASKTWTIKQAKVVAQEKLNTGTLVTVQLPLNDPDGVNGVIFLTSQSPFIISKSGTQVFWSGWMDHSPKDDSPALWHPLTPASIEIEIRNKENGEFKINTRAVEKTDVSLKKVNSERLIHRVDDNTIEVSLYFEIEQANIANVGTISYNDSCAQDVDEHKECRVHILPAKDIMDWVRQRRTSAPAQKAPVSAHAATQANATHKTAPASEKQVEEYRATDLPFQAEFVLKKGGGFQDAVTADGTIKSSCFNVALQNGLNLGNQSIPLKSTDLTTECMIETKDYGDLQVKFNSATYSSSVLVKPSQEKLFKKLVQ
jgi:hypothetical protein